MIFPNKILLGTLALLFPAITASGTTPYLDWERLLQSQQCPGELVEENYIIEVNLFKVAGNCTEDDFVFMGNILKEILAEADNLLPQYEDESMTSFVCEQPDTVEMTTQERQLALIDASHRGLGRYAIKYLGGGVCRRCQQDNIDRRRHLAKRSEQDVEETFSVNLNLISGAKGLRLLHKQARKVKDYAEFEYENANEVFGDIINVMEVSGRGNAELNQLFSEAGEQFKRCEEALYGLEEASKCQTSLYRECRNKNKDIEGLQILVDEGKDNYKAFLDVVEGFLSAVTSLKTIKDSMDSTAVETSKNDSICEMAAATVKKKFYTAKAVENMADMVTELVEMAKDVNNANRRGNFLGSVDKKARDIEKYAQKVGEAADTANDDCEEAKRAKSESELQNLATQAELHYNDANSNTEKALQALLAVKNTRRNMRREIYDQTYADEIEKAKKDLAKTEKKLDKDKADIKKEIEDIKKAMSEEKKASKKIEVEELLQELETRLQEIGFITNRIKFDTVDKVKWDREWHFNLYDADIATSQYEWHQTLANLIQQSAERRLFDEYSVPDGCLDCPLHAEVTVTLAEGTDIIPTQVCET